MVIFTMKGVHIMQISPITSNFQNLIKANISKKTSKKNAMLLCTSGLAALLPAKDFLNKTKTDKLELSGHWETHQPIDSSDYYYQRWVKDEPQEYIPGSAYNYEDYDDWGYCKNENDKEKNN